MSSVRKIFNSKPGTKNIRIEKQKPRTPLKNTMAKFKMKRRLLDHQNISESLYSSPKVDTDSKESLSRRTNGKYRHSIFTELSKKKNPNLTVNPQNYILDNLRKNYWNKFEHSNEKKPNRFRKIISPINTTAANAQFLKQALSDKGVTF